MDYEHGGSFFLKDHNVIEFGVEKVCGVNLQP